ncbi:MAG: deoxyribonuclease IV [Firmicutes bacterium HGW-Firmicutes-7]|nr:MAG: deoxyribonuclease IV [Firmicutes bacterium HGW-Firmicutes-7]
MALYIGSHVSMSGGLIAAAKEAHSYGANTFMIYTGAPQNTLRKPISELKIEEGKLFMEENGLSNIVVHAPYIINLASFKSSIYNLAKSFLKTEIERTQALGAGYLVLHPGAYTEMDAEYGINRIIEALNEVLTKDMNLYLCLETMSGKGSEIGRNFSELAAIIKGVELKEKLGICFDTCHTHDSGYDIINDFEGVMDEFDSTIGFNYLKVFHINGSLNANGARKDRHANLGATPDNPKGKDMIGLDAIYNIIQHPICQDKPLILETPWLDAKTNLYKEEIALLRGGK